jgi:hypothetical protein
MVIEVIEVNEAIEVIEAIVVDIVQAVMITTIVGPLGAHRTVVVVIFLRCTLLLTVEE